MGNAYHRVEFAERAMPDPSPKVAILPHDLKPGLFPGRIALDRLIWPLGKPADLGGKCLGDLGRDDHLVIFPRDTSHVRPGFGTWAQVSIMVLEPAAIHRKHLNFLRWSHRRFHRVLTCNEELLARIPNGVFFPFGSTWVPGWRDLDTAKSRMCSLIASAKRSQPGHVLRHETVEWVQAGPVDVDVMGRGYQPFGEKSEGLAPYRYSIVIENVRERNYFTEKLIDAILCRTLPIYWGCPNIAEFLDTSGMILCETAGDVRRAVQNMSETDYEARLPALDAIREKADYYGDFYGRAARAVLDRT